MTIITALGYTHVSLMDRQIYNSVHGLKRWLSYRVMKGLVILSLSALFFCQTPYPAAAVNVQFLGDVNFDAAATVDETRFNGLSGIAYDEDAELYYLISDDRAEHDLARLYLVEIETIETVEVTPQKVVFLQGPNSQSFAAQTVDFEGIVLLANDNLLISNEGAESRGIDPSLLEFSREGTFVREWPLPSMFGANKDQHYGIRDNLALESLALTPDKKFIFTANEQALKQDGPLATVDHGSPVRIVKYDDQGQVRAHYAYMVAPLPNPTNRQSLKGNNGLVELIALSEWQLLGLERSYLPELDRNIIRLYRIDLTRADDVAGLDSLQQSETALSFAEKELVLDFDSLIPLLSTDFRSLDNLEGLYLGPLRDDGSRILLVVSDGNFNRRQRTQFLILSVAL